MKSNELIEKVNELKTLFKNRLTNEAAIYALLEDIKQNYWYEILNVQVPQQVLIDWSKIWFEMNRK